MLAERAAAALPALAELATRTNARQQLRQALRALALVRPPFAQLCRLASLAAEAVADAQTPAALGEALRVVGERLRARLASEHAQTARFGAAVLAGGQCVLTISASSLVRDALLAAARQGQRPRVICLESRPGREGIDLARALAAGGLAVELAVDAAAGRLAAEADLILVGGDTLSPRGLIHKLGTLGLALAAQRTNTPVYALLGSLKLLPGPVAGWEEDGGTRSEVAAGLPEEVEVWNRYFDATPLELLTGIVTERGVASPGEVGARAAATELHPWLRDVLAA